MRRVFLIFAVFFLISCRVDISDFKSSNLNFLDRLGFEVFGGTFFVEPTRVTMKEIHLDNGALKGHSVVVEGKVVQLSKYSTFIVLADETGKILVVVTELNSIDIAHFFSKDKETVLSLTVLGTLETGKKGVPYLMAKAIRQS